MKNQINFKLKHESGLDFFTKLMTILSVVSPFSKLRPQERKLLTYFLYYNDMYKNRDIEERKQLIFNKSTMMDICEDMGIDPQTFYNNKSSMKRKGIFEGGYLKKNLAKLFINSELIINFVLYGE